MSKKQLTARKMYNMKLNSKVILKLNKNHDYDIEIIRTHGGWVCISAISAMLQEVDKL